MVRMARTFALFCALAFAGAAFAVAETSPVEGGWKGKTKQGYYVYYGVGDGVVKNIRLAFREVICGEQRVHLPKASLSIDESGHFGGAIVENRLEFEGTFVAPGRVNGKIISLETTGLPGCTRKVVAFSAHLRQ